MSNRFEKASQAAEAARLDRIATILRMASQGKTQQSIADHFGITRQRVCQIVQREEKRAESK